MLEVFKTAYFIFGLITGFFFLGDVIYAYMKDHDEAKKRGVDTDSIEAPDLFAMGVGFMLAILIWPSFLYVLVRNRISG